MKLTHEGILALVFVGAVLAMILISICISGVFELHRQKEKKTASHAFHPPRASK